MSKQAVRTDQMDHECAPAHSQTQRCQLTTSPHPILRLQRAAGNQAVGRFIQTKLRVSQPGDIYEQEADRIADQVMSTPAHSTISSAPPRIQRFSGQPTGTMDAGPASVDQTLASPGRLLEPALRQDMEQRFGHDFSRVRVHSDGAAQQSARDVNAHAYTVGQNIVFDAGQLAPRTPEGRRLLAHELTHVVQQNDGMLAIQRAPAGDTRWKLDERAARYRGQLMAKRIRSHGKLSKEARAKINQELAYFEGAAKDAYLREVKPALFQTVEIEMPETSMVKSPPKPRLSLLPEPSFWEAFSSERREFSDVEIYKPLKEKESAEEEEAELAAAREAEIEKLREKTRDWNVEDREFAVSLLSPLLKHTTNIDPRAVSDRIRQPILARYEAWLRAKDKTNEKICQKIQGVGGLMGLKLEIEAKLQPSLDPCKPWFEGENDYRGEYYSVPFQYRHGPSELAHLERLLNISRGSGINATAQVYYDVLEYRKLTDPLMLEQAEAARSMVSGPAGLGRVPGAPVAPTPKVAPTPAVTSPKAPAAAPVSEAGAANIPYAPGRPLAPTQPIGAFEKTEPGGPPKAGPPTQESIPPGGGGGGGGGGRSPRQTIVAHPPPMPQPPPPPRPIIPWFPRRSGTEMSAADVQRVIATDPTRVIWSFNKGNNMAEWSAVRQKNQPPLPPLAYTSGSNVRVDYDEWTKLGLPVPKPVVKPSKPVVKP
jgi:hypothetical protein